MILPSVAEPVVLQCEFITAYSANRLQHPVFRRSVLVDPAESAAPFDV